MFTKLIHIICSLWLALILLFGTTPKEFIHSFANHTDTVHARGHSSFGDSMETEHHHCSFIDFQLMPFANSIAHPFYIFAAKADYITYTVVVAGRLQQPWPRLQSLRGPPSIG